MTAKGDGPGQRTGIGAENRQDTQVAPTSDLVESIALTALTCPRSKAPVEAGTSECKSTSNPERSRAPEPDRDSLLKVHEIAPGSGDPLVGGRIGRYHIVEQIGDGTPATLYRAIQADNQARHVVLQFVESTVDSQTLTRRSLAEINAQAALGKHPNTAPLLDVGTAEDGRAYVVREYVEGDRIDEYCDARRLTVPARLQLFEKICKAVHFAHQHGVIHGELNPSNILVTAGEIPRLVNFGIAKLVDAGSGARDDLAEPDPGVTPVRAVEPVWTPEYTSPEQVQGEAATTASDVYALGVVLYQLLTGRLPYRFTTRATPDVFQAICEQVPEKPSVAVGRRRPEPWAGPAPVPTPEQIAAARGCLPKHLKRILAGDIDMIVLMALRKEPEWRYASAEQLAEDLRRQLKGLPVQARGDPHIDRVRNFARRHPAAAAAMLLLLVGQVAALAGTTVGFVMAGRQRDRAERAFRNARESIKQLSIRLSEQKLLNQPALKPLRKELLQDVLRFYEDLLKNAGVDPALRAELPAIQARIARMVSLTGSVPDAVAHYRQAVALWEAVLVKQPDNRDYQAQLARTLNEQAALLIPLAGQLDEASRSLYRARELTEVLITARPGSVPERHQLSLILLNLAQLQTRRGQPDDALKSLERAIEIESQLAAEDAGALDSLITLAAAHTALARLHESQPGELFEAIAAHQQAIELLENITRRQPELADQACQLAANLRSLSTLEQKAGQSDLAFQNARQSLDILERLDRLYPGTVSYRNELAITANLTSELERAQGDLAAALALARKASALLEELSSQDPHDTTVQLNLARSYTTIGQLLQQAGEFAEALRSFQRAIDLRESQPGPDPANSYNLACNLAQCISLYDSKKRAKGTGKITPEQSKADQLRRQLYGKRAVQALREATPRGLPNPESLQTDANLNALRDRPDFQALLKDMQGKPAPPE